MTNQATVKQSLTLPDFTELGASKLADLLEKGFVITGYCFERQVEGTQPQRGFVDFAGFVGWHQPITAPLQERIVWELYCRAGMYAFRPLRQEVGDADDANAMKFARFIEQAHGITAHGVADMKG